MKLGVMVVIEVVERVVVDRVKVAEFRSGLGGLDAELFVKLKVDGDGCSG